MDPIFHRFIQQWSLVMRATDGGQVSDTLHALSTSFHDHISQEDEVLATTDDYLSLWQTSKDNRTEWRSSCMLRSQRRDSDGGVPRWHIALALLCWAASLHGKSTWFFEEFTLPIQSLIGDHSEHYYTLSSSNNNDDASSNNENVGSMDRCDYRQTAASVALALYGWHDTVMFAVVSADDADVPLDSEADIFSFLLKLSIRLQSAVQRRSFIAGVSADADVDVAEGVAILSSDHQKGKDRVEEFDAGLGHSRSRGDATPLRAVAPMGSAATAQSSPPSVSTTPPPTAPLKPRWMRRSEEQGGGGVGINPPSPPPPPAAHYVQVKGRAAAPPTRAGSAAVLAALSPPPPSSISASPSRNIARRPITATRGVAPLSSTEVEPRKPHNSNNNSKNKNRRNNNNNNTNSTGNMDTSASQSSRNSRNYSNVSASMSSANGGQRQENCVVM